MVDLKSERISAAVLLTYATVTYTSILCFELYGLRPSYAEAYSEVSSFFWNWGLSGMVADSFVGGHET